MLRRESLYEHRRYGRVWSARSRTTSLRARICRCSAAKAEANPRELESDGEYVLAPSSFEFASRRCRLNCETADGGRIRGSKREEHCEQCGASSRELYLENVERPGTKCHPTQEQLNLGGAVAKNGESKDGSIFIAKVADHETERDQENR